jgi:hypothetical protein
VPLLPHCSDFDSSVPAIGSLVTVRAVIRKTSSFIHGAPVVLEQYGKCHGFIVTANRSRTFHKHSRTVARVAAIDYDHASQNLPPKDVSVMVYLVALDTGQRVRMADRATHKETMRLTDQVSHQSHLIRKSIVNVWHCPHHTLEKHSHNHNGCMPCMTLQARLFDTVKLCIPESLTLAPVVVSPDVAAAKSASIHALATVQTPHQSSGSILDTTTVTVPSLPECVAFCQDRTQRLRERIDGIVIQCIAHIRQSPLFHDTVLSPLPSHVKLPLHHPVRLINQLVELVQPCVESDAKHIAHTLKGGTSTWVCVRLLEVLLPQVHAMDVFVIATTLVPLVDTLKLSLHPPESPLASHTLSNVSKAIGKGWVTTCNITFQAHDHDFDHLRSALCAVKKDIAAFTSHVSVTLNGDTYTCTFSIAPHLAMIQTALKWMSSLSLQQKLDLQYASTVISSPWAMSVALAVCMRLRQLIVPQCSSHCTLTRQNPIHSNADIRAHSRQTPFFKALSVAVSAPKQSTFRKDVEKYTAGTATTHRNRALLFSMFTACHLHIDPGLVARLATQHVPAHQSILWEGILLLPQCDIARISQHVLNSVIASSIHNITTHTTPAELHVRSLPRLLSGKAECLIDNMSVPGTASKSDSDAASTPGPLQDSVDEKTRRLWRDDSPLLLPHEAYISLCALAHNRQCLLDPAFADQLEELCEFLSSLKGFALLDALLALGALHYDWCYHPKSKHGIANRTYHTQHTSTVTTFIKVLVELSTTQSTDYWPMIRSFLSDNHVYIPAEVLIHLIHYDSNKQQYILAMLFGSILEFVSPDVLNSTVHVQYSMLSCAPKPNAVSIWGPILRRFDKAGVYVTPLFFAVQHHNWHCALALHRAGASPFVRMQVRSSSVTATESDSNTLELVQSHQQLTYVSNRAMHAAAVIHNYIARDNNDDDAKHGDNSAGSGTGAQSASSAIVNGTAIASCIGEWHKVPRFLPNALHLLVLSPVYVSNGAMVNMCFEWCTSLTHNAWRSKVLMWNHASDDRLHLYRVSLLPLVGTRSLTLLKFTYEATAAPAQAASVLLLVTAAKAWMASHELLHSTALPLDVVQHIFMPYCSIQSSTLLSTVTASNYYDTPSVRVSKVKSSKKLKTKSRSNPKHKRRAGKRRDDNKA